MTYFLSDAHIGSRAMSDRLGHQRRVINLLHAMAQDASDIYLLGDFFDFWSEYFWRDRSKDEYTPVLDCLKEMTDKGIIIHYFIGNHDIWTYGRLARRTGVIIHRMEEMTEINGKRCFLAHGDGLVPTDYVQQFPADMRKKIRRFMRLRALFHNPVAQFFFRLVPPVWGNRLGYNWAKASRLKEIANPCAYKGENREELVLFAKEHERRQHSDYYIFGHRHIELDLELSTAARVIILGDCFRQWTYARMDDNGNVNLLNYDA